MLRARLADRETEGRPVRVGVIGAGRFGTMILCQLASMRGMRPSVVAEVNGERGLHALARAGFPAADVVRTNHAGRINQAIAQGRPALTEDAGVLCRSDVDVVVEVTGIPEVAVTSALEGIRQGKHIVMVTVEADVLVGSVLREAADAAGVVYTAAYGDQPALVYELYDWAAGLGFDVVAAGKGTKYLPAYRKGTPEDVWDRYGIGPDERDGLNPKMYNSFTDGTKSAIEMATVANMTGLRPDCRGMHFPPAGVGTLADVLKPIGDGGILHRTGVVEVVSSLDRDGRPVPNDLRWGVYAVITSPRPYIRRCFAEYGLPVDRTGTYAAVHRPYHLVGMELPISIARVALDHEATGSPLPVPQAAVVCAAKRHLSTGEALDGEGGSTVYGLIDDAKTAWGERLLPVGLSHGARVVRPIPEDALVGLDDVSLETSGPLYALWEQQMRIVSQGAR
jgi:predicted homoserine dehydrogenase-like protein